MRFVLLIVAFVLPSIAVTFPILKYQTGERSPWILTAGCLYLLYIVTLILLTRRTAKKQNIDALQVERSATFETRLRNLPALCLVESIIFAAAALALPFGASLDMAKKSDLHLISGSVINVYRTNLSKAGPKLHILLRVSNRVHHLTQDDLFQNVPELGSLRAGDNVTALVRSDSFGRDLEWVWEIERDKVTLLSYDETQRFLEHEKERLSEIARWAGMISPGLFFLAILLRMHFGTWSNKSQSIPVVPGLQN